MYERRPGEASVQYGDFRGEAAADKSDEVISLTEIAKKLGFEGGGDVVGISVWSGEKGPNDPDVDKVYVTFQVVSSDKHADLQAEIDANDGVLQVRDVLLTDVNIVDVLRWFKRLSFTLFTTAVRPRALAVAGDETLE